VSNRPTRQPPSTAKVSAAAGAGEGRTPVWIWLALAGVVVLTGVIAFAVTSGAGKGLTAYGTPELRSEALPMLDREGGADPAVGRLAPEVAGEDFRGEAVTIPGAGRAKIVMFLAHWCPHCQAEVPRLTEWIALNGMPADVDLYSVATGTDSTRPNYPPGPWLEGENWPVPVLVDDKDGSAGIAFGLSGFPFFVVVDADGKVVQRTSGELTPDQWTGLLEAARTGTPSTVTPGGDASSPA
jgi:thiol-disulfide isomerase/thioredoxin